ncbi:thiosulfate/3-mercaptopyruvate sulfurtransferase 1, mitochondrial isoform X2 [Brassica napus]|uniref:thiosulfate/3-mercaptopyruvate sulfurtransferase 1, mitochondrial isoform X2 n=1 Tax=Brassica napus TaxID=3708 RepID=UPI000BBEBD69|nr:thiosulfate/3-mercaptopyruvate sulfurtransferase 1, mitochondrial isoform X2 [Brassica napus]
MRVMSWYMPDEQRNPIQEYQVAHIIPGALFFDLDGISDRTTSEAFSAGCSALGIIDNNDGVVVYDGKGMFSAARVWWKFRVSGHEKVWVLDGGLPRWRALGNAIFKASAASEAIKKIYQGQIVSPVTFKTKFQPHLVWTLDQVLLQSLVREYEAVISLEANVSLFLRCLILLLTHSYQQKTLKK